MDIPAELLPQDGRFGSGPAKVRPEQITALQNSPILGTSHRQAPVRALVEEIQTNLLRLFQAPEGYEVVLGLGGATAFWDIASFGLVNRKAQHLNFGEFGGKFAKATDAAPFLDPSSIITAPGGELSTPIAEPGVDVYAWPQNETSTGVIAPVQRVTGSDPEALTVIDGTSAAGGVSVNIAECDVYYFAPQKNFSSDGGLWFALMSPAALDRAEKIAASDRWIPDFLKLKTAIDNSRQHQSYNTPALATLVMLAEQLNWLLEHGGLAFAHQRTTESSQQIYTWAESSDLAMPFVQNPAHRSPVVATVDFADSVDATWLAKMLRSNGIVDVEPYRKLGRNQLRIACFVSIDPTDISALLRCLDFLLR